MTLVVLRHSLLLFVCIMWVLYSSFDRVSFLFWNVVSLSYTSLIYYIICSRTVAFSD